MPIFSKEVIKRLKADGWEELPGRSTSHKYFKHPDKPGKLCVPHPRKDMKIGTLKAIAKQAGVELQ